MTEPPPKPPSLADTPRPDGSLPSYAVAALIAEVEEVAKEMKWQATVEDEHAAALDAVMSDQESHAEYSYENGIISIIMENNY